MRPTRIQSALPQPWSENLADRQAGRVLRWWSQVFGILAAAILSTTLGLEAYWAFDPEGQGWPTALSAVAAWVFLQMTALSVLSGGLSRAIEGRCCSW